MRCRWPRSNVSKRGPGDRRSRLPFLRRPPDPDFRRPRRDAVGQRLSRDIRPARSALSAACAGLLRLPSGPGRRRGDAGAHLRPLRLFLELLGVLGRARAAFLRGNGRAVQPFRRLAGGRGGLQRRLPAASFRGRRHSGPRHRTGRQRRRGGACHRRADRGDLLRSRNGEGTAGTRPCGRPAGRQQRAGPCAGHQRFRCRARPPAQGRGRPFRGVPSSVAPDGRGPVRHHLSRALLLPVAAGRRAGVRGPRTAGVRCRGTADPWRQPACAGLPQGGLARRRRRPCQGSRRRGGGRARRRCRLRRFRGQGEGGARFPFGLPCRSQGRGQAGCRLRRRRQGQHAAQLLRRHRR